MSQENVEIVRRHIETWNRRDLTAWLALYSPDAEIDWSRARGPLKGVYRGRGERETLWNEFFFTFEEAQIKTPQGFTDAGSEVVVSNTTHFRGREGIEVTASSTWVFTVENGQITRLRLFQEREEALEAAGLRE
jgi:ketosteroid isomerase-like protein